MVTTDKEQTLLAGILTAQLAFLILRYQSRLFKTSASLPADILSLLGTAALVFLSLITHQRSLRCSSLVSVYLTVYAILGIARVRTLWLIAPGSPSPSVVLSGLVMSAVLLVVESLGSTSNSHQEKQGTAPERYSSFWNRAIFAWLAATFRIGYRRVISVDDLPQMDSKLESSKLHQDLIATWGRCESTMFECFSKC